MYLLKEQSLKVSSEHVGVSDVLYVLKEALLDSKTKDALDYYAHIDVSCGKCLCYNITKHVLVCNVRSNVLTWLVAGQQRERGSISAQGENTLSSPKLPYRPWRPIILLFIRYREFFHMGKVIDASSQERVAFYLHFTIHLHRFHKEVVCLYRYKLCLWF